VKHPQLLPFEVGALSRSLQGCPDPVHLFRALCAERGDTLLLESADQSTNSGNKSLVLSRAALRISCCDNRVQVDALSNNGRSLLSPLAEKLQADVTIDDPQLIAVFAPPTAGNERDRLAAPSPLDVIRAAVLELSIVGGEPTLPPLCAGSLSYDLIGVYESLPPGPEGGPQHDLLRWPDFELWLAEELVWIQHAARRTTVLRYVFGGDHVEASFHDATAALANAVATVEATQRQAPLQSRADRSPKTEPETDVDDDAFAALVVSLKRHIVAGDVFQIVPSRTFSLPCPDPLAAYAELRALNPSPYMFFVRSRAGTLFGASPESALTARGTPRRVAISPIAGTRQRGRHADGSIDADLDARIEVELRLDDKEVAEHMMLVDLARNDVARVSRPGSRTVDELLSVVRYSHVMHLVSLVSGELRDDLDALHAYVATMNMGTLVGAPKLEAASLLRQYEATRRGPYGGAVGYLTADGELDTCIVIRSATVTDGVAHVRAGCGVVYDSDPAAEALETRRKAEAVLVALRRAAP